MANIKDKKRCIVCNKYRTPNAFYKSKSAFHADGLLPVCSDCILEKSLNDDHTDIDTDRFSIVLRQCDKPFIAKLLASAIAQTENNYPNKQGMEKVATIIGFYMKNLNGLVQYQNLTWDDSNFGDDTAEANSPEGVVVSEDGYTYTAEQFEAVLALFKYLLSSYKYKKGTTEYELLKVYAALRLQAEAAAAENDVDTYLQHIADCGDILTNLHWDD